MENIRKRNSHPTVAVIVTVFNEAKTILLLLTALQQQTLQPHEVIIVDACSSDQTATLIRQFAREHKNFPLHLIIKKGNRSVGRNTAVAAAHSDWMAITDAGCIPHKDWLEKLISKANEVVRDRQTTADQIVVAGYYEGLPKTAFEEAVVPYVLVMPNHLHPQKFLPATRSMLIAKKLWQRVGGLNENYEVSEDYELAQRIVKKNVPIFFTEEAKVGWLPRSTLRQFFKMTAAFAAGDVKAGVVRPKVIFLFVRYLLGAAIALTAWWAGNVWVWGVVGVGVVGYLLWAIYKNYAYTPRGWYYLPLLQCTADLAVIYGTLSSLFSRSRV